MVVVVEEDVEKEEEKETDDKRSVEPQDSAPRPSLRVLGGGGWGGGRVAPGPGRSVTSAPKRAGRDQRLRPGEGRWGRAGVRDRVGALVEAPERKWGE